MTPVAKFALAMATVIDTVLAEGADALPVFAETTKQTLQEARTELAKAVAVFQASGENG
jgi:hypothetical protein